jgi:hypothetical protein
MIVDAVVGAFATVVTGFADAAVAALSGALGALHLSSVHVPFLSKLNEGLPLSELLTMVLIYVAIKVIAIAYLVMKEVLGYIPFLGIGKH